MTTCGLSERHALGIDQMSASALAELQISKRKRKEVPVSERQPLLHPEKANQVWSMDWAFAGFDFVWGFFSKTSQMFAVINK